MPREIKHHEYFGDALLTKKRGFAVKQGVIENYVFNMQGYNGENLDIGNIEAEFGIVAQVETKFLEASLSEDFLVQDTGTILDKSTGKITFKLPEDVIKEAGVYLGEVAIKDEKDNTYAINEVYIYVEPSHQTKKVRFTPLINDIRLSLRDSSLFENELLGNYEYDVAEISYAVTRVVRFWNELPPPVAFFSTRNFPFTNLWLTGTQLYLFDLIQEHYRRNQFPYSAGGFSVDDRNKFQLYRIAWTDKMAVFTEEIKKLKRRLNVEDAQVTVPGPFSYYRTI